MPYRVKYKGEPWEVPDSVPRDPASLAAALDDGKLTPLESQASPPSSTNLPGLVRRGYEGVNTVLGRAKAGTQQTLEAGGAISPWLASLANPVPGNVPEAAVAALTSFLGLKPGAGGAVRQLATKTGIGAAGGAAIGGIDAMMRDKEFWPQVIRMGAAGAAGGSLAGLGHAWDVWRTGDTRRATELLRALGRETGFSPEVRAALPKNPRGLFERPAGRAVSKAASDQLERELIAINVAAGAPPPFPLTTVSKPSAIPSAPDKLDRLQGVTWIQPNPLVSARHPMVDVKSGQRLVAALREVGEEELARKAELGIIAKLNATKPGLGDRYQRAVAQYGNDAKLGSTLKIFRDRVELPGGALPTEFPELAKGLRVVGATTPPADEASRALVDALLAGAHPTSFYGAGHAVAAGRRLLRGPQRFPDPTKIGTYSKLWSIFRRLGPSALGVRAGEAIAPDDAPR